VRPVLCEQMTSVGPKKPALTAADPRFGFLGFSFSDL